MLNDKLKEEIKKRICLYVEYSPGINVDRLTQKLQREFKKREIDKFFVTRLCLVLTIKNRIKPLNDCFVLGNKLD